MTSKLLNAFWPRNVVLMKHVCLSHPWSTPKLLKILQHSTIEGWF